MLKLNTPITYLKGVGPKKAEILKNEAQIETIADLLYYFPFKYVDRSKFHTIREIQGNEQYIQIIGEFISFYREGAADKERLIGIFKDQTGQIEILWFKGLKYFERNIKPNKKYLLFGKPSIFKGKISIIHPEIELLNEFKNRLKSPLEAYYTTTEKMKNYHITSKTLAIWLRRIFETDIKIPETLPEYIIENLQLMPLKKAIYNIHFPTSITLLEKAKYRLKFEEFFINQLTLLQQNKIRVMKIRGFPMKAGNLFKNFYKYKLPFELTEAQKRVISEIYTDIKSGRQCNRLIQGDVGSGKTIVALMIALIAIDSGFQVALMAPTEILAQQHYQKISSMLKELKVNIKLLTGSTKTSQRRIILEELLTGDLDFIIGTHALIEENVKFKNLGLAIIDEQHRFGVIQRSKLWQKNNKPPHVLVMSATPIPRTLAMTLYGDLDVSIIDQLPPGRKPIRTFHIKEKDKNKLYPFLRKKIEEGQQIYVVYPLISESEKIDSKHLEEGYEIFRQVFPPPKYNVIMMHGKMKPQEKKLAMDMFLSGKANILVSTQVIEVGVDVPNATVMVIESAERFGLSQLHQLRGRVGRGSQQAYCILITKDKISKEAEIRMQTMVRTNDGFEIAETDMKLRGPGDIFGTRQSGIPIKFRIADIIKDQNILSHARKIAASILKDDPLLQKEKNKLLKLQVEKQKNFISFVG